MSACSETLDLRKLTGSQLEELGRKSLREHLLAQAILAHQKHAPVTADNVHTLLNDPDCLRYPVRILFEFGEMAAHQFAQPEVDWSNPEKNGRILYVRPLLRKRPDLLPLAVAYMIPLINFGEIITDGDCLAYGATLLGLTEDEFYEQLCDLCHFVGAETK